MNEAYAKQEDMFQLTASLSERVVKNHAFKDTSKRTSQGLLALSAKITELRNSATEF